MVPQSPLAQPLYSSMKIISYNEFPWGRGFCHCHWAYEKQDIIPIAIGTKIQDKSKVAGLFMIFSFRLLGGNKDKELKRSSQEKIVISFMIELTSKSRFSHKGSKAQRIH